MQGTKALEMLKSGDAMLKTFQQCPPGQKIRFFLGGRTTGGGLDISDLSPEYLKGGGDVGLTKAKRLKNRIRENLVQQLTLMGADPPVFIDHVDDYMALWETKELLKEDIRKNGIRITYDNGGGQTGEKENPSVQQQVRVNAQMLKILAQLGIATDKVLGGEVDEL